MDREISDIIDRCSKWELDALRKMGMPIARGRRGAEVEPYKPDLTVPDSRNGRWRKKNAKRYQKYLAARRAERAKHRRMAA